MRLYIGSPKAKGIETGYVKSLLSMDKPFDGLWWDPQPENVAVDIARNRQANKFLKMGYDYLLFADIDATWAENAVNRLISRDLPIVSGVIFRRCVPPVPVFGPYIGNDQGNHIYSFGEGARKIIERTEGLEVKKNDLCLPKEEDDLYEVGGHGMHFCLIKREVLKNIPPPWFKMTELGAGEDFYFSRLARKHGFKLHVDLSVYTGHEVGPGIDVGLKEFLDYHNKGSLDTTEDDRWEIGGWA